MEKRWLRCDDAQRSYFEDLYIAVQIYLMHNVLKLNKLTLYGTDS